MNVGRGLATADTEGKIRIGAELLILLLSVLETIVPFQVSYGFKESNFDLILRTYRFLAVVKMTPPP